ncbi:MAG: phosphotransferase [Chloroflexi bacterium]|nr:phosphotransferase [Chloroflexota bacterium]
MRRASNYVDQIRTVYPELIIHSSRLLTNGGQFSIVLFVNDALVFRFPRSEAVARSMARELTILAALQGKTTLPIPNPIYQHVADGLPAFMGYPLIYGDPAQSDTFASVGESVLKRVAAQIVEFLREVHATQLDLPEDGTRDDWAQMYQEFREQLYPFMRADAQADVSATFEAALNHPALWDYQPVLRHGDFGTRNILYDPQTMAITGVIDFGMSSVGDPAQDVGAIWSLGDRFMEHFFALYPEMRTTVERVKFIRSTYALQQALYALREGNQEDFDDGIQQYI